MSDREIVQMPLREWQVKEHESLYVDSTCPSCRLPSTTHTVITYAAGHKVMVQVKWFPVEHPICDLLKELRTKLDTLEQLVQQKLGAKND
jgi:hypothetical protein